MRPNFDDDYSRHGKLRVNFSVYIPWMVQISIRYQLRRKTFETGGGTDSFACISTHMLGGSGGMFPQEKFLLDALRLLLRPLFAQSGTTVIIVICTSSHV